MMALHARRSVVAILVFALGFAALASLLPENPYQRWQLLDGTIHSNARWIYERIHNDPAPIDVAFVGPSRIQQGVNAPRLSEALAARGLPSNVVNFALPESGRNINAVVVEEMLKEKRPRLIVLGTTEKPSRFGHSAYKYIAPREELVDPGYLGNLNYLSDLAYLPFRQLRLFAAMLFPDAVGLRPTFEPASYAGRTVQTTGDIVLPDGTVKNGTYPASAEELARGVHKLEAGNTPPILPRSLADLEFGDEHHYVSRIAAAARAQGVPVVFLMLPYHTGPGRAQEDPFYARYGDIWSAGDLADRAELFSDYGHLTSTGAAELTDRLVAPIARILKKPQTTPPARTRPSH